MLRLNWDTVLPRLGNRDFARIDHDCGPGSTLKLTREGSGVRAWCFRCNDSDTYRPNPTLAQALALILRQKDLGAAQRPDLPEGSGDMRTWPREAIVWLAKAGMGQETADLYGIRYSSELRRVVLPVFNDDGEAVYWQARDIFGGRSKYLSPAVPRGGVVFKAGRADVVGLVEDALSAIRVGEVAEGWSTLGTAVLPSVVAQLKDTGKRVVCMFDPDKAGAKANRQWLRTLRTLAIPTTVAVPRKDPKLLARAEIRSLLSVT